MNTLRHVSRVFAFCIVCMATLVFSAGGASAAPDTYVNNSLCQVDENNLDAYVCQSVTGVYNITTTKSGLQLLTVHLLQEQTLTSGGVTAYSSLQIDEQYVYRSGEPVVVTDNRLQTDANGCTTTSGRLVFANGELRFEAAPTTECPPA